MDGCVASEPKAELSVIKDRFRKIIGTVEAQAKTLHALRVNLEGESPAALDPPKAIKSMDGILGILHAQANELEYLIDGMASDMSALYRLIGDKIQ